MMKCQRLAAGPNTCAQLFLGMFMWLCAFRFLNLFESYPLPLPIVSPGVFPSFVFVDKVGLHGLQSDLIVVLESDSYSIAGNA